jgi:hypothetical protein
MKQGGLTKGLSPDETAKVLVATISILNAAVATTGLLHDALIRVRERGVDCMDAECDRALDEVCEVLRLMGEGIPKRLASALLEEEGCSQNAPSVYTVH